MSLIRLRDLHLAFGGPQLLSGASLTLDKGERICLVGRNGTGKSTLLKIISGQIKPDEGVVEMQPGIKIAWLEQEVPQDARGIVFDVGNGDAVGPAEPRIGVWLPEPFPEAVRRMDAAPGASMDGFTASSGKGSGSRTSIRRNG